MSHTGRGSWQCCHAASLAGKPEHFEGCFPTEAVGLMGASLGRGRLLTCGLEDPRVAQAISGREGLHHAVDLLRLSGKSEAP